MLAIICCSPFPHAACREFANPMTLVRLIITALVLALPISGAVASVSELHSHEGSDHAAHDFQPDTGLAHELSGLCHSSPLCDAQVIFLKSQHDGSGNMSMLTVLFTRQLLSDLDRQGLDPPPPKPPN